MRKITIVLLLISMSINAQLKVGINGGAALTHLKFDSDIEQGGVLPSYFVGGLLAFKMGRFEPELEISYTESGDKGQIKIRETFDGGYIKYESDYKIPMVIETVSAKLYITEKFCLRFGGYLGQILSVENEYERPNDNPSIKTELSNKWKKTDAGIVFGFNVGIAKNLFLESSFIVGITDMRGYGDSVTNRMVRIGAGYYFL